VCRLRKWKGRCRRLRWRWLWGRRRKCGEFAAAKNPYPDETVCAPCCGKAQIIKELDIFGQCVRTQQRNDVEFSAPVSSSRAPRKYQSMSAVFISKIDSVTCERAKEKWTPPDSDDSLFVDEKTGNRLERRHIPVGNGRPSDCDQLLGRIEP
jgi:hypothetical protein